MTTKKRGVKSKRGSEDPDKTNGKTGEEQDDRSRPGPPDGRGRDAGAFPEENTNVEAADIAAEMEKQLEAAKAESARLLADMAALRTRAREEKEKTVLYATEAMIKALLPILDDFDRAIVHVDDPAANPLDTLIGVKMIHVRLLKVLEQQGVRQFEALGERFDPFRHEALRIQDQEGLPPGTITEEHEKGFYFHDRVLRASRVSITPLAPKEPPAEAKAPAVPAAPPAEMDLSETVPAHPRALEELSSATEEELAPVSAAPAGEDVVDAYPPGEGYEESKELVAVHIEEHRAKTAEGAQQAGQDPGFGQEENTAVGAPPSGDEWLLDESAFSEDRGTAGEPAEADVEIVEERTNPELDSGQ
jgi:molecular chaperone GrpE